MIAPPSLSYIWGLVVRRMKWHRCELNRILASWDQLPRELAHEAALGHIWAIAELRSLSNMVEGNYGPEEKDTRKYLEWEPDEYTNPEAVALFLPPQPGEPGAKKEKADASGGHRHPEAEGGSEDDGGGGSVREWLSGTA